MAKKHYRKPIKRHCSTDILYSVLSSERPIIFGAEAAYLGLYGQLNKVSLDCITTYTPACWCYCLLVC